MAKSKSRTEDTVPALIDNEAHAIIIKISTDRKLSRKWSREECSMKYLISEAIKQVYGSEE